MSASQAGGAAHDAGVQLDEQPVELAGQPARSPQEQDYLDAVAEAAGAAVHAVENHIEDLQASLEGRRAEAARARAEAQNGVAS